MDTFTKADGKVATDGNLPCSTVSSGTKLASCVWSLALRMSVTRECHLEHRSFFHSSSPGPYRLAAYVSTTSEYTLLVVSTMADREATVYRLALGCWRVGPYHTV